MGGVWVATINASFGIFIGWTGQEHKFPSKDRPLISYIHPILRALYYIPSFSTAPLEYQAMMGIFHHFAALNV